MKRRVLQHRSASPGVFLWGLLCAATFAQASPPKVTLERFDVLPAATFAADQPVQGVSSIAPGPGRNLWWALSDNGYGTRDNSAGYVICIYLFQVDRGVRQLERIELRDPQRHFPWALTRTDDPTRTLTGADADPESMVVMEDGSFWIGDEHGPWLLHFSRRGELIEAPVRLQLPDGTELRSVSHPDPINATLRASRGFEGLARGARPHTLLAMLEGAIPGDPPDMLRIFEFDLQQRQWTGRYWLYPLDDPKHSASEIVRDGTDYLVIERDDREGDAATFKRIFRVALDDAPRLRKTLRFDLLDIDNPRKLAQGKPVFRFPFLTTEAVWPIGAHTLEVVNDNNYPAAGGRDKAASDPTEWIRLKVE
jgi:hypothetical protein